MYTEYVFDMYVRHFLDVTIFGYLEDVDHATGNVHYITEGRVLLSHRPTIAAREFNGVGDWNNCMIPPYTKKYNSTNDDEHHYLASLRQAPRIGSVDTVYQSGEHSKHHFSTGI